MKSHVVDFTVQTNSGIIAGSDYQRYTFSGADWMESAPPRWGMQAEFTISGDTAVQIRAGAAATLPYNLSGVRGALPRQRDARLHQKQSSGGPVCHFPGLLGIHKFYLGCPVPGIILLLCGAIGWFFFAIPPIIAAIICLIEGVIYLTKSDGDFHNEYGVQKKSWF